MEVSIRPGCLQSSESLTRAFPEAIQRAAALASLRLYSCTRWGKGMHDWRVRRGFYRVRRGFYKVRWLTAGRRRYKVRRRCMGLPGSDRAEEWAQSMQMLCM